MSITKAAELVRAYGRGNDSQLMHVTPSEVQALQGIARAKGGSLTINPNTGLPEAGFLEDALPAIAGTVIGSAVGMPWLGAAIGGLGTYAMTGSLEKGLMAGLGAFGGASFGSALGAAGAAPTVAPAVAPAAAATDIGLAAAADAGLAGVGANVGTAMGGAGMTDMGLAAAADAGLSNVGANMPTLTGAERFAGMGAMDRLSSIGSGIQQLATNPSETWAAMGGLKGQGMNLGMMAAPLLSGAYGSSGTPQPEETGSYVRPTVYDPKSQTYTYLNPVKTSDWGSQSFQGYRQSQGYADGGIVQERYSRPIRTASPEVQDYNRMLMEGAQREYIQGIQRPAFLPTEIIQYQAEQAKKKQEQEAAGTKPAGEFGVTYDPVSKRYVKASPAEEAVDSTIGIPGNASQNYLQTIGYNPYSGVGGGAAQGGRIRAYQAGGIVAAGQIPKFQEGGEMESDAFVVPADVVSALGNGSTDAGVKVLNEYIGMAMPIEGEGDGMSDDIPATIEGMQAARVADGEVYIPPDVVEELGDGDIEAGSRKLYEMMDKIRQAAHGKKTQQRQVAPEQVMPE